MKNLLLFFIFCFLLFSVAGGQSKLPLDTRKYRLELPDYWKPGNKIWRILSDKLPLVARELKDTELCGDDCNPKYRIQFEISEPEIFDHYPSHVSTYRNKETWEFTTFYGFSCCLLLTNDKNELITRFILVDTNEVWQIKHRAELMSYKPSLPQKLSLLSTSYYWGANATRDISGYVATTGYVGQTPFSYIINNEDKLAPVYRDLMGIVDSKIRSW